MGKVDHLRNRVEPFAALFWAGPASLPHRTQRMFLYGHNSIGSTNGSILNEDVLGICRYCMLFIYALHLNCPTLCYIIYII